MDQKKPKNNSVWGIFERLASEVICHIFLFLKVKKIVKNRIINKSFSKLLLRDDLWFQLCVCNEIEMKKKKINQSYLTYFKENYKTKICFLYSSTDIGIDDLKKGFKKAYPLMDFYETCKFCCLSTKSCCYNLGNIISSKEEYQHLGLRLKKLDEKNNEYYEYITDIEELYKQFKKFLAIVIFGGNILINRIKLSNMIGKLLENTNTSVMTLIYANSGDNCDYNLGGRIVEKDMKFKNLINTSFGNVNIYKKSNKFLFKISQNENIKKDYKNIIPKGQHCRHLIEGELLFPSITRIVGHWEFFGDPSFRNIQPSSRHDRLGSTYIGKNFLINQLAIVEHLEQKYFHLNFEIEKETIDLIFNLIKYLKSRKKNILKKTCKI